VDNQKTIVRFLTIIFLFFSILSGYGQDIPAKPSPPRLVNDFVGGLLSAAQIQALEQKLVAYNDSTSSQLTIVIVKSVQPYESGDVALKILREWGVGQKDKNNGIVLLWAPGDRKLAIQTGYGMEGVLPDMYAKRIISNVIGPKFKELKYYEGLDEGTTAIFKDAAGEYKAEPEEEDDGFLGFIIILLVIIFIIWIFYKLGKNNKGGGGLFSDSAAPYTTYTGWGSQTGSWGGGWSSGGGGGGFGGFGGGSGGGGGASGDY
jgi:uncharacterized protein